MSLYPMFADLRERAVLVVGGGEVAWRKVVALQSAGALVTVGAPQLCAALQAMADQGQLVWWPGVFAPSWLAGMWLVVAATDSRDVNRAVAEAGAAAPCFVNVVDDPELSHFQVPAVIDRAPLTLAISTGGAAPMLARRVRERLESLLDPALGPLAALLARFRGQIQAAYPDLVARRAFYDRVLDGEVAAQLRQGSLARAEHALDRLLAQPLARLPGRIVLVGAGPGDPGALTLAALRALNLADTLWVAPDVAPAIVALARKDASRPLPPADLADWGAGLRAAAASGLCAVALLPGAGLAPPALGLVATDPTERVAGLPALP